MSSVLGTEIENEISSRGIKAEHWCTCKHLLHAEGHIEESMANAVRHEPQFITELSEDLDSVRALRQKAVNRVLGVSNGAPVVNSDACPRCSADLEIKLASSDFSIIRESRKLKKKVEGIKPSVRSFFKSGIYNVDGKKYTVTKKQSFAYRGDNMKEILMAGAAQAAGAMGYDIAENIDVTSGKAGAELYMRPSTWIDVIGGLALAIAPMYVDVPEVVGNAMAVTGTHMLGRKVYDVAKGTYSGMGGTAIRVAPRMGGMRPTQKMYPGSNVQVF